jgi:p-aminobenzoyl-glutamate transporter AbgT
MVGHTGSIMDDPNTLFAAALGVVAIIVAIGKLIQWVWRHPD